MKRGESRAEANKKIRQDALREQLRAQGHEQHAVEILGKIRDLSTDLDAGSVNRLRIAFDGHMRLLGKYLPDVKAVELTIDESGEHTREDHAAAIGELIDFPVGRGKMAS